MHNQLEKIMSIFGQMGQNQRIRDSQSAAGEARAVAKDAMRRVDALEERIAHLTLLCNAMWELLRDKSNLAEADLAVRAADIDSRDGKLDGKLPELAAACVKCGKPRMRSQPRCIYCGTDAPRSSAFESI